MGKYPDAAAVTGLPEASLILAAELEYAEGAGLKITPQTQDPYFFIVPSSDTGESFSFAEYPILKIRMKNESPSELGELYIATNGRMSYLPTINCRLKLRPTTRNSKNISWT